MQYQPRYTPFANYIILYYLFIIYYLFLLTRLLYAGRATKRTLPKRLKIYSTTYLLVRIDF
jgi:hypothetical protein